MENTDIEWADHTHNEWEGCQKVGLGCDRCYAEALNARFAGGTAVNWGPGAPRRRTSDANRRKPLRWNANHDRFFAENGRRQRVFCESLGDWLDNAVPVEWLVDLLDTIRLTTNLDWLLLSKRIGNFTSRIEAAIHYIEALPDWHEDGPPHSREALRNWLADWVLLGKAPSNVFIGATIVNQEEADRDVPKVLAVPARVRFVSMEPLLGPVTLRNLPIGNHHRALGYSTDHDRFDALTGPRRIDWVIVGGESGHDARYMHPDWPRSLRDQCEAAGVAFMLKQWGKWGTAAVHMSTGEPVFRQFESFQQWVNKAPTWVNGGICVDRHGRLLRNGGDMARARDAGDFPVTVLHKLGKKASGRLLDGVLHNAFPEVRP
ncbi:phage Gp37/Gp68 family protein [Ralstonia sp. ASV6]|uniref:phage Gp37/Gp68 family protein n=1 Tax=Ralstonia sp. ASV6 TaxID=2795124 RepID=UPI0018ED3723|nr:phage Gp37/Gp68 family protein [Ralstonia sp. ASV6]